MGGSLAPPQFTSSISIGKVFRFQASAAGSVSVTGQSLGDLLCQAATATSAYQMASAVRIRRVEIWGPPSSTLTPVTVTCEFAGASAGSFGPSQVKSDTSVGATRVAHVVASPPRDSQASQWQSSSSTGVLFVLTYPSGAIIDIHYSFTMQDRTGATAVTGAVAGATVGQVYLRSLDSVTSSAVLVPLSFITI